MTGNNAYTSISLGLPFTDERRVSMVYDGSTPPRARMIDALRRAIDPERVSQSLAVHIMAKPGYLNFLHVWTSLCDDMELAHYGCLDAPIE